MTAIKYVFHDRRTTVVFDVLDQTSARVFVQVQDDVARNDAICTSLRDIVKQEMRSAL